MSDLFGGCRAAAPADWPAEISEGRSWSGEVTVAIVAPSLAAAEAARADYLRRFPPYAYGTGFYLTDTATPGRVTLCGQRRSDVPAMGAVLAPADVEALQDAALEAEVRGG